MYNKLLPFQPILLELLGKPLIGYFISYFDIATIIPGHKFFSFFIGRNVRSMRSLFLFVCEIGTKTVDLLSSPRGARFFHELRRYHTRPLRLNWGSENVHLGKNAFLGPKYQCYDLYFFWKI